MMKASSLNMSISLSDALIIRPENPRISVDHTSFPCCSCMKKTSVFDTTATVAHVAVVTFSFGSVADGTTSTGMRRVVHMCVLHVSSYFHTHTHWEMRGEARRTKKKKGKVPEVAPEEKIVEVVVQKRQKCGDAAAERERGRILHPVQPPSNFAPSVAAVAGRERKRPSGNMSGPERTAKRSNKGAALREASASTSAGEEMGAAYASTTASKRPRVSEAPEKGDARNPVCIDSEGGDAQQVGLSKVGHLCDAPIGDVGGIT